MDQDLGALGAAQRHGVAGLVQRHHLAVERRDDGIAERLDRDPVAHHPLGKDRVGNFVQRRRPPSKRRGDDQAHRYNPQNVRRL